MSDKPTPESYGFDESRIPDIEKEIELKDKLKRSFGGCGGPVFSIGCFLVFSALFPLALVRSGQFHGGEALCSMLCPTLCAVLLIFITFICWSDRRANAELSQILYVTESEVSSYEKYLEGLSEWKAKQQKFWEDMEGRKFEKAFADLLNKNGWNTKATKGSGDGGIDLDGSNPEGERVLIQCKWWSKPCGEPPIRDLAGVVSVEGGRGLVVCKSGFTKQARGWGKKANIQLWDIKDVMRLVDLASV